MASDIFASILSEARKYRLNLILSHQYLDQLKPDIIKSILGNVGSLICFRLGSRDALELETEFAPRMTAIDLENIARYKIYLKLSIDGLTSMPFSADTLPPVEIQEKEHNRENIIKTSRQKYSTERAVIEDKINRWFTHTKSF